MYSLLFRGATMVDGSGKPSVRADVALKGGKIAAIAAHITGAWEKSIDAQGLVLAPGFIDIHSHTDTTIFRNPGVESKAFQGVTVEVVGNCGLGVFPVNEIHRKELAEFLHLHDFYLPEKGFTWHDFTTFAEEVDRIGAGINLAPLVGHGALRIAAMGSDNREPEATELDLMRGMLDQALRQGAWGMSTGLIYPPGSFADTRELIELAKVLANHQALYASHIRHEGSELLASLDEAIAIGRGSGARVQVSHLKALGKSNWDGARQALLKISAAKAAGVDIAADQYPYCASATTLATLIPPWAQVGGVACMVRRLQDPKLTARLAAEIAREIAARDGAEGIMVSNCGPGQNRQLSGLTVGAIAKGWGLTPEEGVRRLLVEENGLVGAIFFSMSEEDVTLIMADSLVAVGSDGHGLDAAADGGETTHPRSYGTFPRILGRYVRESKVLSLETAIRKMTSLPASRLGFTDRGLIRPGFVADLVLFDPATIKDLASYRDPHHYAQGVVHLLVGGELVIHEGKLTGRRPGRVLRKV